MSCLHGSFEASANHLATQTYLARSHPAPSAPGPLGLGQAFALKKPPANQLASWKKDFSMPAKQLLSTSL